MMKKEKSTSAVPKWYTTLTSVISLCAMLGMVTYKYLSGFSVLRSALWGSVVLVAMIFITAFLSLMIFPSNKSH